MRTTTLFRKLAVVFGTLAAVTSATMLGSAASQRFYDDDPIRVEPATQDASGIKPLEVNLFVDLAANIVRGGKVANPRRAQNVNTIDEVPDSSWFTNRAGARVLTPEDVANGPDTSAGPAAGAWTVTSSKSDGVTPGFTVKDAAGQRWFLKFDPPGYRGMTTGTEVAVTKLMWALGYNVPENHIAYMRREQLVVGADAKFTPVNGTARRMRIADVDALLSRAEREPDGSYRIVASRAVSGAPIGRIRFVGTRPDDPNDLVAHEDRRELRGYGVFAAWLNHVDAKAINSLDTLVTENGRAYVRHHLMDFGSALGSGGVGPADYWAGEEGLIEPREVARRIAGFGFYTSKGQASSFYETSSVGRLRDDNAGFNPDLWKPRVPNQAFLHARRDDQFWAARKLSAMTPEVLRAAVHAGEFGDRNAEDFLVRALGERRDAILRAYLTAINPISDPALGADGALTFTNVAVEADVARAPEGYRASWFAYDNATGASRPIAETSGGTTTLHAPGGLPGVDGAFIKVSLSAIGGDHASWEAPVNAYFRLRDGSWRWVGFERIAEKE
jgi:hypothetical protein